MRVRVNVSKHTKEHIKIICKSLYMCVLMCVYDKNVSALIREQRTKNRKNWIIM